jgi:hypothetical protein
MSTDYAEKERDFIASLDEDTGRDLAGWMTAISDSGHTERNAIIDWLRHQGFQFAKASWLERIHHNGGRLIYAEDGGESSASGTFEPADPLVHGEPPRVTRRAPLIAPPDTAEPASSGDINRVLSGAKGLRPLADLILREVARAVPGVTYTTSGALIIMSAPKPFAALLPAPKRLRLYGSFGADGVHRAKPADGMGKSAPQFPEMLVLDDARHVDEDFRRLIRFAARL